MNKLLVICGPTATGKTELGIHLAGKLASGPEGPLRAGKPSELEAGPAGGLVSADSRQVYKDMDIGTGKDLPKGAKWHPNELPASPPAPRFRRAGSIQSPIGFWQTKNRIQIWGYDLVSPKEEFSVAQYEKIVEKIFDDIWKREKLPILVGGTGLYIKAAVDGIQTSAIPKNDQLRQALKERSIEDLFEKLSDLDPVKAASLNRSDKKNPRRLIRAIEIAQWRLASGSVTDSESLQTRREEPLARRDAGSGKSEAGKNKEPYISRRHPASHFSDRISALFIGLKVPREILQKRIKKRVEKRLKQGLLDEIRKLLANGVDWGHQSMNAIGYQEWEEYFYAIASKAKKEELQEIKDKVIKKWTRNERQYAKRQMTWFKKDKRINWFDATEDSEENVEKMIHKWYSSSRK